MDELVHQQQHQENNMLLAWLEVLESAGVAGLTSRDCQG
jgi:hypothetical protein